MSNEIYTKNLCQVFINNKIIIFMCTIHISAIYHKCNKQKLKIILGFGYLKSICCCFLSLWCFCMNVCYLILIYWVDFFYLSTVLHLPYEKVTCCNSASFRLFVCLFFDQQLQQYVFIVVGMVSYSNYNNWIFYDKNTMLRKKSNKMFERNNEWFI